MLIYVEHEKKNITSRPVLPNVWKFQEENTPKTGHLTCVSLLPRQCIEMAFLGILMETFLFIAQKQAETKVFEKTIYPQNRKWPKRRR